MTYRFIPNNLKPGGSSCIITIQTSSPLQSVRWCEKEDFPYKMKCTDPLNIIRVKRNGTYLVELITTEERTLTQFSVCHLKPYKGFAGGDGSLESPYLISNCAQFNAIRINLSAHYRLVSDLNFEKEMKNLCWIPIGSYSQREPKIDPALPLENQDLGYQYNYGFTGELDGGWHSISGLISNHPKSKHVGVFGSSGSGAYIHHVLIENSVFSGECAENIGSIVGQSQDTIIEKCFIRETLISTPLVGGGIVGHANRGTTIRCCQFQGDVEHTNNLVFYLGGVVGCTGGECDPIVKIEDCCVKAKIGSGFRSSGIVSGLALVARCFFSGVVRGSLFTAGIVCCGTSSLMRNCVIANAEICFEQDKLVAWKDSFYVTEYDEMGKELGWTHVKDGWENGAGRITCADPYLIQKEDECLNFSASSCHLHTLRGAFPAVDGSLRDGKTVTEDSIHDFNFYCRLGWDFENIWVICTDGMPGIKINKYP